MRTVLGSNPAPRSALTADLLAAGQDWRQTVRARCFDAKVWSQAERSPTPRMGRFHPNRSWTVLQHHSLARSPMDRGLGRRSAPKHVAADRGGIGASSDYLNQLKPHRRPRVRRGCSAHLASRRPQVTAGRWRPARRRMTYEAPERMRDMQERPCRSSSDDFTCVGPRAWRTV